MKGTMRPLMSVPPAMAVRPLGSLIDQADQALCESKRNGRNRVTPCR